METDNFKLADDTLEAYYKAVIPPFLIGYLFMLLAAICVVVAILKGFLDVPKWFVLLNPFVFLFVGVGLRKIKPEWFYDLPGIQVFTAVYMQKTAYSGMANTFPSVPKFFSAF